MRTLKDKPTARPNFHVAAWGRMQAIIRNFAAAYSEYAWHYTGMLCEQYDTSASSSVRAGQPLTDSKDGDPWAVEGDFCGASEQEKRAPGSFAQA